MMINYSSFQLTVSFPGESVGALPGCISVQTAITNLEGSNHERS
jgi:hypothetical protein